MGEQLLVATRRGLLVCQRTGDAWQAAGRSLTDRRVTSVIAREGVILAGTTEGVYRSDDGGQTWHEASTGLTTQHVRWLAYHPDVSDLEFAGTEPAGIFASRDGARTWREAPRLTALREEHGWFLPYSPEAGCVRGFAVHGSRLYAAVEVGGVLRSDDGGVTWDLAQGSDGNPDLEGPPEPFVYPDVHSIEVHPSSSDLVFAPTGGGFYRSADGGQTWECLYDCYCRAVWSDARDADHLILGPADGVDSLGRIEATKDGGRTWQPASAGLQTPWRRHMVERFVQAGQELLAILSNGQIFASPLAALVWQRVLPEVGDAAAACYVPASAAEGA